MASEKISETEVCKDEQLRTDFSGVKSNNVLKNAGGGEVYESVVNGGVRELNRIRTGSFFLEMCHHFQEHVDSGDGDFVWLHKVRTGETFRASEFQMWSKKFAAVLAHDGFKADDTLHACVGNHNLMFPAFGGVWSLGGVVSPCDVALFPHMIASQLKDLEARFVLCVPDTSEKVKEAVDKYRDETGVDVTMYCFGAAQGFRNMLALLEDFDPEQAPPPVTLDDKGLESKTALVFWTSGTTGMPKGICHSQMSLWNCFGFGGDLISGRQVATTTCFFHIGGFMTAILACVNRQTIHHLFGGEEATMQEILETIADNGAEVVHLGSHHFVRLARSEALASFDKDRLHSLKQLVPNGAAIPINLVGVLMDKLPNLTSVTMGYGQSETGVVTGCMLSSSLDFYHLGTIFPGVQIKVVDPKAGEQCGPGEVGEICLKSNYMMLKYLNRPKETQEFFAPDGFGRSGDMGYFDKQGFLIYVDRAKELIKYKNNHIAPTEIEEVLFSHPAVLEAIVFGRPCDEVQELVCAFVVKRPGFEDVDEQELIDHVNARVMDFKKIRGGIKFGSEVPRNSVGKLVRMKMRQWALEASSR